MLRTVSLRQALPGIVGYDSAPCLREPCLPAAGGIHAFA
jgi:hypothetical protein